MRWRSTEQCSLSTTVSCSVLEQNYTIKNTPEILIIYLLGKLGFSSTNDPMISTVPPMDPKVAVVHRDLWCNLTSRTNQLHPVIEGTRITSTPPLDPPQCQHFRTSIHTSAPILTATGLWRSLLDLLGQLVG